MTVWNRAAFSPVLGGYFHACQAYPQGIQIPSQEGETWTCGSCTADGAALTVAAVGTEKKTITLTATNRLGKRHELLEQLRRERGIK